MEKFKNLCKNHYYLLTALLMFLSFPSYDFFLFKIFPVAAWFSMVPLFIYIKGRAMRDVFFTAFISGLAGNLLTYGWIGSFGAKVPGGFIVILLFLIPSLTAFFVIKILVSEYLSGRYPRHRIFIFPSVWIVTDFAQSIGFLAFPWTYIGYSQYQFTPFIQAASVVGILGINFIMVLFNTVFSEYLSAFSGDFAGIRSLTSNRWFASTAAVIALVAVITMAGFTRLAVEDDTGSGKKLKIAIVQSCISPWENWPGNRFRYLSELVHYTKESLAANPDFIVWSESATLELISFRALTGGDDEFDRRLFEFVREAGRPLLTGEIGLVVKRDKGRMRFNPQNNAILISGAGEFVKTYPKIHLVPFGEWFPYERWFSPVKGLLDSFGASSFVPGEKPMMFNVAGLNFGALICYEGIFFRLCREYRKMGADFLVNITNDGWTDAYNGHYQHYSASVFRAVENGLWMVRAGNTGVTAIIDPKGRAASSLPILKKGFMTGEIDTSRNIKTLYSSCGDIILYVSMLFIAAIGLSIVTGNLRRRG